MKSANYTGFRKVKTKIRHWGNIGLSHFTFFVIFAKNSYLFILLQINILVEKYP